MATTKKEIRAFEEPQAVKELLSARQELQALRAKAAGSDLKNVRAIRAMRQSVARLATRVRELKASPHP